MVAERTARTSHARIAPYPSGAPLRMPPFNLPDMEVGESQVGEPQVGQPPFKQPQFEHPNQNKENQIPPASNITPASEPDRSDLPSSYLDVPIQEKRSSSGKSEVPCYEDVSSVP